MTTRARPADVRRIRVIVGAMNANEPPPLTDRQARAVLVAAEELDFEREPDLYEAWYDLDLHDDAQCAVRYLRRRDPDALSRALVAGEVIPADEAAARITDSGRFTEGDANVVIAAAAELGFTAAWVGEPGLLPSMLTWERARAALAFMWATHPLDLTELLGEISRLAPLPPTARSPRSTW